MQSIHKMQANYYETKTIRMGSWGGAVVSSSSSYDLKDYTWKDGVWHSGTWIKGIWQDGIWKEGHWYGGEWLNGQWDWGHIWLSFDWRYLPFKVSPKCCNKPKRTLSLNYAKYT